MKNPTFFKNLKNCLLLLFHRINDTVNIETKENIQMNMKNPERRQLIQFLAVFSGILVIFYATINLQGNRGTRIVLETEGFTLPPITIPPSIDQSENFESFQDLTTQPRGEKDLSMDEKIERDCSVFLQKVCRYQYLSTNFAIFVQIFLQNSFEWVFIGLFILLKKVKNHRSSMSRDLSNV